MLYFYKTKFFSLAAIENLGEILVVLGPLTQST